MNALIEKTTLEEVHTKEQIWIGVINGAVQWNLHPKLKSCLNWGTPTFFWEEMAENSRRCNIKKVFWWFLYEHEGVWGNWELCLEVDWDISVKVRQMKWEMVSVGKERELNWGCRNCNFHLISGDYSQFPAQRNVVLRLSGIRIRCVYSLQAHLEIFVTISSNNFVFFVQLSR